MFKVIGTTLGLIVFIPIVLVLLLIFFMRPEHGPDVLAKVTVDIEVEGEPVLIERIVECRTFEVPPGEWFARLWRRAPTRYFPVVRGMGARLKSGGAIMMYTPYLCDHEVEGSWPSRTIKVTPNPPGALPMMAWTENVDDPEELEVYVSEAYFRHPKARVKINRIKVTDPPPGARADPPGEFSWFAPQNVYYKRPKRLGVADNLSPRASRSPRTRFSSARGYRFAYQVKVTRETWGKSEETVAALEAVRTESTGPAVLPRQVLAEFYDSFRRVYNRPYIATRRRIGWIPGGEAFRVEGRRLPRGYRDFSGDIRPVRIESTGVAIVDGAGPTYLLAITGPLGIPDQNRTPISHKGQITGTFSLGDPTGTYVFDSADDILYLVYAGAFVFEGE